MKSYILLILSFAAFAVFAEEAAPSAHRRLVSLSPAVTEQIFLLGCGGELVGNTTYCDRPDQAKSIEKVGTVVENNIEKIILLKPDIVFVSSLTKPDCISKLRSMGYRTELFKSPENFEELFLQFGRLGKILAKEEAARKISETAIRKMEKIQAICGKAESKPGILFQIGSSPLFVANRKYFINDFIEKSNAVNIAADNPTGLFSKEEVVKRNPDLILITAMGIACEEEKQQWLEFKSLSATVSGRIHSLNSSLICRPNPKELPDTLLDVAILVHPELKEELRKISDE